MRHEIVELRKVTRGGRDYLSDPRRVWMSLDAAERAGVDLSYVADGIGPRRRGMVYRDGYWGHVSTVHDVFVSVAPAGRDADTGRVLPRRAVWWEVAEESADDHGRIRRHCTSWVYDRQNQPLFMIGNRRTGETVMGAAKRYMVQTGKGSGVYKNRYPAETLGEAEFWYAGLNIHSGYKKRLVDMETGKVLHRYIS